MIRELKYMSGFEYLPDDQLFTYQGTTYLKFKGEAIPYIDEDDMESNTND